MRYMLLIYEDEKAGVQMSEAERGQIFNEHMQFYNEVRASGHFLAGDPLQPVATAKSLRVRKGKPLVTDGPFAETREQLGGYYILEVKDEQEALDLAARIPSARFGTIEVRPIMEIGGAAGAGD
jgi:hypothetical protein